MVHNERVLVGSNECITVPSPDRGAGESRWDMLESEGVRRGPAGGTRREKRAVAAVACILVLLGV